MQSTIEITTLLAQRLKNREVSALDYLFDHYSAALYGVISRTLQHEEMAEEVLTETFLKIWQQAEKYDPAKGTLFTWMYRIARNLAIDKRRSRDFLTSEKSEDIDGFVDMFETRETREDFIGLGDAIDRLGSACKKLIQLNFFMGYSHAEISKKEGMALGSVKTKLRSCLKNLKKDLSTDFG